ncbi:Rossmann-like and DUF2520 domain-containing protein [Allonocardiopsis opalescens]|uniref:Putative short-subunit dehydrogenase-like oxidoreductase (DUF2520 family) n=1 Tax=Allonocardiopsis opalescens TaxID=1144618 RepID=A0A2T0Q7K5_9ACTN|nr:DUF2520 domain-containing protein [Allonocardiopsis opalescens]PRX99796.1 putative short-subunit dehydrogenase-like oxidoreductase (DUF2520 family) [Allonocardiopsis opalescens]
MEELPVRERPARLRVGVVGAGRVGSVLGAALSRAGHDVTAASGVSDASRRRIAARLPGARVAEPPQVVADCDLVLLSVPDDALPALAAGLAELADAEGTLVAHTSGRYGHTVLDPLLRAGALPLALHPVMTFTGRDEDLSRLASCSFGVTSPDRLRPIAEALVVEMGGEPVWIPEERRGLYHAALAGAANHLVTLVAESAQLLGAAGVEHPGRMLGPLLGAALDNGLRLGTAGLSGPVVRGDAGTVARHLEELAAVSDEALAAYRSLARLTAVRALDSGLLKPDQAEALLAVLNGPAPGREDRRGQPE